MAKPTFLGIGAQKCATTWLYDILADHPAVCMSSTKEVDYFSRYYDYGHQWYEGNFPEAGSDRRVVGEISPSYLHEAAAPARVRQYQPAMKLICVLREPAARALSNHRHEVRIGRLTGDDLSFERGLANNPTYVDQGLYATHLERWLEHFPRDQLLILLTDTIATDPAGAARRVYEFLGIDAQHESRSLVSRANESYVDRFTGLARVRHAVRDMARSVGVDSSWDVLARASGARRLYRRINRAPSSLRIPSVRDDTWTALGERFANEIERLEVILGRPLEEWEPTSEPSGER